MCRLVRRKGRQQPGWWCRQDCVMQQRRDINISRVHAPYMLHHALHHRFDVFDQQCVNNIGHPSEIIIIEKAKHQYCWQHITRTICIAVTSETKHQTFM